ncbi:heparan-sulfate 6-O-sulfotransferase 1-like isoform X1 [Mercenaria mercenaria]|uniref:heparan-sulfate 6-O-sulfotransferase 1-like isoform X1 n=1 Tax=Mercenaria mercenaria TaxID=6596 RepID=UPI00234EA601|nr:heparan-sulfate 6-O-sulfotransferase 1-like isoform X1 [Mercenaria mercenaria]XP_053404179.1 heparan-sulfate 6-O-sulfotransferase 1-like isoform X1 [Mercenaria mercenaria]
MRKRRTFQSLKFLIYLLGLMLLFCVLIGVNMLRPECLPYDSHVRCKMVHSDYTFLATRRPLEASPLLNITRHNERKETVNETKVDTKSSKDIARLSNNVPKPVPRTRTFTIAELMKRAKEDQHFLTKILSQYYWHPKTKDVLQRYFTGMGYSFEPEFKTDRNENLINDYDIYNDVMVFLHIQKTGGTHLNERLASRLQIPFKCNCPKKQNVCPCLNPKGNVWIYSSRFSGWPCGLHADRTQLHRCLPGQLDLTERGTRNRRYFYFTQLRDPIARYMSEFYHQSVVGGHWQDALLGCGPGFSDWTDIRPCFVTETWRGVTLDNFMACQHNLATNRMTRMLADLNRSDCYRNYLDRKAIYKRAIMWTESAKENLQQMPYFGFMEDTEASDKLFSHTFKMRFKVRSSNLRGRSSQIRITEEQFMKLVKLVELDIHTYLFAKDLFQSRLRNL